MRSFVRRNRRSKPDDDGYSKVSRAGGTIYLQGDITPKIASDFRRQFKFLERLEEVKIITIEINSNGGDIESGFLIVDTIELSSKPVTTRVTGNAMSMATLILAAGEIREALPNALIMAHQGSYRMNVSFHEVENELAECKRVEKLCNDYLESRTGKPSGFWEQLCNKTNLYMMPQQALELGIINSILKRGQPK